MLCSSPVLRFARQASIGVLLVILSTLIIVLPVPYSPSRARAEGFSSAESVSEDSEGFNFSDQSAPLAEAAQADASKNALKPRTAPVSASGAFLHSVQIDVPPGRAGMTPALALSYSSEAFRNNSPVGAGWSLSVPSISRDTSGGFPARESVSGTSRYTNGAGAAFTGPAGRMFEKEVDSGFTSTSGARFFAPEREQTPVRYEFIAAEDRWIEHLPSGNKRYFGAIANREGRVVNELGTHEWLLLRERDPDGNYIDYDYHELLGDFGQYRLLKRTSQALPILKSVRWGGNDVASVAHMFRVETTVASYDGLLNMMQGHTLLMSKISRIRVFGPDPLGSGAGERVYWDYTLQLTPSAESPRLLLKSVTRQGYTPTSTSANLSPQGPAIVHSFGYSANGSDSFGATTAGQRNTCDAATRASYSAPMPLSSDPTVYRSGYVVGVTNGPAFSIDKQTLAEVSNLHPMDALSPEFRGAGYRFEDFDSDGDNDLIYHPTGLGTPAARWLHHKSYYETNGAGLNLQPVSPSRGDEDARAIPGRLLISSFADIDGDSDPDAVSFPVYWNQFFAGLLGANWEPILPHFYTENRTFTLDGLSREQRRAILLSSLKSGWILPPGPGDGCQPLRMESSGGPLTFYASPTFGMESAGLSPLEINAGVLPPVAPPRWMPGVGEPGAPTSGWIGTIPDDDHGPIFGGDLILPPRDRIGIGLGRPCTGYVPWWVKVNAKPLTDMPMHMMVAYNSGSNTDTNRGPYNTTIADWPAGVTKQASFSYYPRMDCAFWANEPFTYCDADYLETHIDEAWGAVTSGDPSSPQLYWDAGYVQRSDFNAPMADVNGDGKSDIVLLKSIDIRIGESVTNYVPRVYLSRGNEFVLDRFSLRNFAVDITDLIPFPILDSLNERRGVLQGIRDALTTLRPLEYPAALDAALQELPATYREQILALINEYDLEDPWDDEKAASFQSSLVALFEEGLDQIYAAPIVPLRDVFTHAARVYTKGFSSNPPPGFFFDYSRVPNVAVDLTDVLIEANNRIFITRDDLVSKLRKDEIALDYDNIHEFFDMHASRINWGDVVAEGGVTSAFGASFSDSARDILMDGRNTHCSDVDNYGTCNMVTPYPIAVSFNTFMLDLNADGLPELITAHRPTTEMGGNTYRVCGNGHQVHLNRGYRWDDRREAPQRITLRNEGWSTPAVATQYGTWDSPQVDAFGASRRRSAAFDLLNQRDKECDGIKLAELPDVEGEDSQSSPFAFEGLPMSALSTSDVNADGLVDAVFSAVTSVSSSGTSRKLEQAIYLNTGRGFRKTYQRADPVTVNATGQITSNPQWCGVPGDFFATQFSHFAGTTFGTQDRARLADVDSDGLLDVVTRGDCFSKFNPDSCTAATWRRNLRKVPDLLTSVRTTGGAFTDVDYVAGTSDAAFNSGATRSNELGALRVGQQVVSEIRSGTAGTSSDWQYLGASDTQRVRMSYRNFAREQDSSKALGFERVIATFVAKRNGAELPSVTTVTTYDIRPTVSGTALKHPLRGVQTQIVTTDSGTGQSVTSDSEYQVGPIGARGARIRLRQTMSTTRASNYALMFGTTYGDFDELGYARRIATGRSFDGKTVALNHPESTVTTTAYDHRKGAWRLGRTTSVETVEGRDASLVLSHTATSYLANGRLDTQVKLLDYGQNDCVSSVQAQSTKVTSYNSVGLPEQIKENDTRIIDLRYDPHKLNVARRWTVVPASGSSPGGTLEEQYAYDLRFAAVRWHRGMNLEERSKTYDPLGRLLVSTGPGNVTLEVNSYTDSSAGPAAVTTTTYTNPGVSYVSKTYLDGAGRPLATITQDRAAPSVSYVRSACNRYDGFGRAFQSYQPRRVSNTNVQSAAAFADDKAHVLQFDGFDRLTAETRPDGNEASHQHSLVLRSDTVYSQVLTKNPRAQYERRIFDGRGELTGVEYLGASAAASQPISSYSYARDGAGRITRLTDGDSTLRDFGYDVGGRLATASLGYRVGERPLEQTYCYDQDSKLSRVYTSGGRDLVIERDVLGREVRFEAEFTRPSANGLPTADRAVTTFGYECWDSENALGRLCHVDNGAASYIYDYDSFGRRSKVALQLAPEIADALPPALGDGWWTATYHRGWANQLTAISFDQIPGGEHRIDFAQDLRGRIAGVTVDDPVSQPRQIVKEAAYDEFSRVSSVKLGNDVVEEWTFDKPTGYLQSVSLGRAGQVFSSLNYPLAEYDENGNPRREQRLVGNTIRSQKDHTYDALDRLQSTVVRIDGSVVKNEAFTYSAAGNIATAGTDAYEYSDAANTQSVTGIVRGGVRRSLSYDDDGWLAADVQPVGAGARRERSLSFDAAGCLKRVEVRTVSGAGQTSDRTIARNWCAPTGERLYRETTLPNGTVDRVFYMPGGIEIRPSESIVVLKVPVGSGTVGHVSWSLSGQGLVPSESGYVHSDSRGSVIARTAINATNVASFDRQAEYDAWGATVPYAGTTPPRYGFIGEESDPGTGYYSFGRRAYDPTLRRWLSPDPLIIASPSSDEVKGSQLNLYSYAGNNPVVVTDRTGSLGDTPANWERLVEQRMATEATERPQEYLQMGIVAGGVALTVVILPEASAGTLVGAMLIGETVIDGGNMIIALLDLSQNPSLQSMAGVGMATVDILSGPNVLGEMNSGRVLNQSRGSGRSTAEVPSPAPARSARGGVLPTPPTGPGRVAKADRDPKRVWTPGERAAKREAQKNKCADGCGTDIDASNSQGHHVKRHADGGKTDDKNHAEVCTDCHKEIHSARDN